MKKPATEFSNPEGFDAHEIVDLRDLEAPEPMVKILMACTQLGLDEHFIAHLPHVPNPLFPHLHSRGLNWEIYKQPDESALLDIWRIK